MLVYDGQVKEKGKTKNIYIPGVLELTIELLFERQMVCPKGCVNLYKFAINFKRIVIICIRQTHMHATCIIAKCRCCLVLHPTGRLWEMKIIEEKQNKMNRKLNWKIKPAEMKFCVEWISRVSRFKKQFKWKKVENK